jgi:hypothetical protein
MSTGETSANFPSGTTDELRMPTVPAAQRRRPRGRVAFGIVTGVALVLLGVWVGRVSRRPTHTGLVRSTHLRRAIAVVAAARLLARAWSAETTGRRPTKRSAD